MRPLLLLLILIAVGAKAQQPVVVSLLGTKYYEPRRTKEIQARLESDLQTAKKNFEGAPTEENYTWYGRRTGYMLRLNEAVDIFTQGLQKYPDSYRLLRHRGHRYISLRQFDKAIADLQKAELLMAGKPLEVEQDGVPNKLNKPLSTTQFNVFYHLALAHYLKGEFAKAEEVWRKSLAVCENDDSTVAVIDWLYMTLQRESKPDEAKALVATVGDNLTIIENDSYYTRIKLYKSGKMDTKAPETPLEVATLGYGYANWFLYTGKKETAVDMFRNVIAGTEFAAFGFIAAEAELARMQLKN